VGGTTPLKPVTIGSPGAKIASAAIALDAHSTTDAASAASRAVVDLVLVTLNSDSDTVAISLPVYAPSSRAPQPHELRRGTLAPLKAERT